MIEKHYDSKLLTRDQEFITIQIRDKTETYAIISFFEFSSERGMMSILLEHSETKEVFSFAKGSD